MSTTGHDDASGGTATAVAPERGAPSVRRRPGGRILIAEDDVAYGCALRELLERDGHRVEHVTDGESALQALASRGDQIDLLLCDLLLPRRSGFDIVKAMNELEIDVPVLAMTSVYDNSREIHALRGMGVKGYIHKSSPFEHLVFRVNQLLFPGRGDTRVQHRVAISLPVQFFAGDRPCYGTSYNISVSGLYVRTTEPVLPGTLVEIAMTLPTAREMVKATVEVMHAATAEDVRGTAYPAGFGARFAEISPLASAAIKMLVDSIRAEESGETPACPDATD